MNTKISKIGFASLIFFLTEPMFFHVGITEILNSSNDSILSIIIGFILSLFLLYFFIKIFNYEKDLDLFKKIEKKYKQGKLINFILVLLFSFYFIYMLYTINIYVQNKYLDSTPNYIIILLFLIPVIWCSTLDIKTISKVSISVFIVSFLILLFSIINLLPSIEIDNYKPILNTNISIIIINSIKFMAYFITPSFMLLLTPKNKIEGNNIDKTILILYLISFINILLLFIFIIGIFGIDLARLFSYPEYALMKKINYFDFIQHIENITTIGWLYSIFISSVISLNFVKTYLNHINKYNKIIYSIIIFICFIISLFIFNNTTISYNFIKNYYIYIFFIPILLIIIIFRIKRDMS